MRNNCVYINELPASSNCISISTKHVGKVGTGFRRKVARELHQVLAPLAIEKPPLETVRDAKTMWVRPQYQTEIEYRPLPAMGCPGTRLGESRLHRAVQSHPQASGSDRRPLGCTFRIVSAENLGYGVDPSGPQCGHLHNDRSLLGAHAMGRIRVANDHIALPEKAERRPAAIPEGAWPRLMRAPRAASFLDISTSYFLAEVKAGRMPQPKRMGRTASCGIGVTSILLPTSCPVAWIRTMMSGESSECLHHDLHSVQVPDRRSR